MANTQQHTVQTGSDAQAESASPIVSSVHRFRQAENVVTPRKRDADDLPGLRYKRKVTRACDLCKAKRSKCSGEQPCEKCNRRGLQCRYEAVYSRGKAPTPRRVERSARVEGRGGHAQTLGHGNSSGTTSYSFVSIAQDVPGTTRSNLSVLAPMPAHLVPDRAPISEAPSRGSPTLEVTDQYSDTTSGLAFLHRAWQRISNGGQSKAMSGHPGSDGNDQLITRAGDKPFQQSVSICIPSLDRGYVLFALYFDVAIATYRILHRPTVESWFKIVSQNYLSDQPLDTRLSRAKTSIVLTVLAVACLHEEKARGEVGSSPAGEPVQLQSDELFCEALRLTDGETGYPKLESVQVRLIQVFYLLMSSRFNQAWYTFGHALQMLSAMGLHRRQDRKRLSPTHQLDYIGDQCKKRTFWVAYILDKSLSAVFGRPRHYHDDDIDQDFPDTVNDEDMTSHGPNGNRTEDCLLDSLIFNAKLAQISEKISREVYSIKPVPDDERLAASHSLGEELRQWRASLPPILGSINPNSLIPSFRRQVMALRMSNAHAVMLAHRPFILKKNTHPNEAIRKLAQESVNECITAAQAVLEAVDRMAQEGRLFHAFWWTHYVCFCALVVVYVWAIQETAVSDRHKILDQADHCHNHLAQATASNSPSRKYSIILQELRDEAKKRTAQAARDQTSTAASTLAEQQGALGARLDGLQEQSAHDLERECQPLFGSPMDPVRAEASGLQNLLDDWQTTDWLDLDSSAFSSLQSFNDTSLSWIDDV
jgi:hypothetical protein